MKLNTSVLLLSASLAVAGLLGCGGSKSQPTGPGVGDEADQTSGANDAPAGESANQSPSNRHGDPAGNDGDGVPFVTDPAGTVTSDPDQTTTPVVNPEFGLDDIVDRLLSTDVTVERTDEQTGRPYFTPEGELLRINGHDIQAYTYESAEAAKREAILVSPDGSKEGVAFIRWPGPMHFYEIDRYILVYIGEDEEVIASLDLTFGGAFAGDGTIDIKPEPLPVDGDGTPTDGGTSSRYDLPAAVFFATSEEDVERLLSAAGDDPRFADELAVVDFESSWVLVVFRGVMPSAGYDVTIEAIRHQDGMAEVMVSLRNPGPNELVAEVITYPFDVEVIARSDISDPSALDWAVVDENGDVLTKVGSGDGVLEPGVVVEDGPDSVDPDLDPGLEPEPLPVDIEEKIDIRGTISSAVLEDADGTTVDDRSTSTVMQILVEGEVEPDTNVDRALVSITPSTLILEAGDGDGHALTARDLEAGMQVEVRFSGPVMESYPVQAEAEYIIILR